MHAFAYNVLQFYAPQPVTTVAKWKTLEYESIFAIYFLRTKVSSESTILSRRNISWSVIPTFFVVYIKNANLYYSIKSSIIYGKCFQHQFNRQQLLYRVFQDELSLEIGNQLK